jgi:hypothetical protein
MTETPPPFTSFVGTPEAYIDILGPNRSAAWRNVSQAIRSRSDWLEWKLSPLCGQEPRPSVRIEFHYHGELVKLFVDDKLYAQCVIEFVMGGAFAREFD